ncbi:hypothetical protein NSPZN2_40416 [Nitrospira defluvii]|uniref:Transposase n=1 Tax=Nitrospira defluvii TaxID=330214 RepID=A0ABM8RVA8_9BACT|nr:hypothetical protein NSPZN2_40416 [Nitrospira defluvii]
MRHSSSQCTVVVKVLVKANGALYRSRERFFKGRRGALDGMISPSNIQRRQGGVYCRKVLFTSSGRTT